jgi:predicted  nucleic acid-binding Zn-ribbon protein
MAKKKELTVEDKLRKLYDLQLIHSRIDRIHSLRGELPLEVQDLEDEISGLTRRMERLQSEIDAENAEITNKRNVIKDAELLIKRYEEQQMNVRNNREYDALSKEIEFQKLEIELAEKRIREYSLNIEHKTEALNGVNEQLEERNKHLEHKNAELDKILKETEKEEAQLQKAADKVGAEIEDRLLNAYHRIRENAKNGLAVVTIERNAIGGSFFTIPPQQQMEIAQRKKIMTSEHCGRILVDAELASEEEERMNKEFGELA